MVTVYSMPSCPYCEDLKTKYRENNIEFRDINILLEENAKEFEKICEVTEIDEVPVIRLFKKILIPNVSFKTIDEAVIITQNILKENEIV